MFFKIIILIFLLIISSLPAQNSGRFWIYLKDKDTESYSKINADPDMLISERALSRRQLRGSSPIYDSSDLPLSQNYISELEYLGVEIHHKSRWLNAVSCYLDPLQVEEVVKLPFVKKVEPVRKRVERHDVNSNTIPLYKSLSEDYGPSFNQNNMLGIPAAHDMGYNGEDVLIAVFDTGFLLDHNALQHIDVVAAWDFIYDDDVVEDEDEDVPGQHNHGTQVLSTLAGFDPGNLIGPAYASQFLLAKTDHLTLENQQDEDNWVAAAEWAENLGADIISSSLGYILDYSYEDMDGKTAASTIAAGIAVKKGVAVFNSAGNEGRSSWGYIIAPADGDSVIAMGGATPSGNFWTGSSRGPTFDGRIKPDLTAQAQYVYCVNPRSTVGYTTATGTSLSCPLGSGCGAIILSMVSSMKPMELRNILTENASQADNPDNFIGYGIINMEKVIFALTGEPMVSVTSFEAIPRDGNNEIRWVADLELSNKQWIISRRTSLSEFSDIGEIDGREFGTTEETYSFYDFNVAGGESFIYRLSANFLSGNVEQIDTVQVRSKQSETITLNSNSPNPFNSETKIIFGLNIPQRVSLKIYNIRGQLIRSLIDNQEMEAQFYQILWDGKNNQGNSISSGTYFLRLTAGETQKMMKMLYLK
jgi:subtilisin family serine protease